MSNRVKQLKTLQSRVDCLLIYSLASPTGAVNANLWIRTWHMSYWQFTQYKVRDCSHTELLQQTAAAGGDGWQLDGVGRGQLNPGTPAAGARAIHGDRQGQGAGACASDRTGAFRLLPCVPPDPVFSQLRDEEDGARATRACFSAGDGRRGRLGRGDGEDPSRGRTFIANTQSPSALPARPTSPPSRL